MHLMRPFFTVLLIQNNKINDLLNVKRYLFLIFIDTHTKPSMIIDEFQKTRYIKI